MIVESLHDLIREFERLSRFDRDSDQALSLEAEILNHLRTLPVPQVKLYNYDGYKYRDAVFFQREGRLCSAFCSEIPFAIDIKISPSLTLRSLARPLQIEVDPDPEVAVSDWEEVA